MNGSSARGDEHKFSDIDSIGVFSDLDDDILKKLRVISKKYENTSIYTLSLSDLIIYPDFKYYTLTDGTVKIIGDISFLKTPPNTVETNSIINNLFTIMQISRSYMIAGNYGPRAHYILKLMYKLADHGCLRLMYKNTLGKYPNKKEEVKELFKNNFLGNNVIDFILTINSQEENIKLSLFNGEMAILLSHYRKLNAFAEELLSMC